MQKRLLAVWLCMSPIGFAAEVNLPPAATIKIDFQKHVWPMLVQKCHSCHGAKQQQSGLRLDKRQNALRGGDYGPVIVAGKSAESKLILRLVGGDGGLQMPPTGALSNEEIGIFRAWIDQGADFAEAVFSEKEAPKPVDPKLAELISAVRSQDIARVRKLVAANPKLVKSADANGATPLHHAASYGTGATVQLLLDGGADINARNSREATPLHWAIGNTGNVKLLLDKGAEINPKNEDGRTPLYLAATQRFSANDLQLLLERGADPNLATIVGGTPLMVASATGDVRTIQLLLAKKAQLKAMNGTGATALFPAVASGNVEAVRLLLDAGLDVKHKTKRLGTVLDLAASQGFEEVVKLLLERGAEVNRQDSRGYSPLMYAAYSEAASPAIVKLLLAKGADTKATGEDETAQSLAGKRGDNEVARLLGVSESVRKSGGIVAADKLSAEDRPLPAAIEKALHQLANQSPKFTKTGGCNSCHNQSIPSAAIALARDRGIPAPKSFTELPDELVEFTSERVMDLIVISVNSVGYQMMRNIANHRPSDEYTDAVVRYLKMMQTPAGYWQTTGNRPPLTFDDYITTAMAINTLRVYGPPAQKADTEKRLALAAAWLQSAQPVTTQERAFHLLGLLWSNGDRASIERSARGLAATQRADGGWSQLPTMGSDAYATGEALYALNLAAKMAPGDAVYQKGVRYLLRTQAADGTWHVKTRAQPFQPYFESGFPYGHDQWISSAGTAWASMALSLAVEPKKLSAR